MKNENDREPELTALEWQAFRYLAGELNDTDLGNFETHKNPATWSAKLLPAIRWAGKR
jgi:hypothetical protein